ncbi:MAG: hypothetical protein NWR52_10260, partial [Paracoccaceae bacterium]|nr:hypothetical protein [Paracoccaceae bacterium]
PLPEAVEILGAPRIALRFCSDKPLALVSARLNDVRPDGSTTRVGLGLLNLTHRDSHEHPTPLEPGQDYDAVVEMDDIAHHFPAGHRIAVALSTVYYPLVWPSPELVTLTIHCGASELHLPIRPPRPEDDTLRPFDPPEEAAQTPVVHHTSPATNRRRITRDLLNGTIVVDFPRWTYAMEMTDIEQTQISTGTCRHEITEGDPLSAATYTDNRVEIRRKDTTILHHSTGSLTCDATHFIVQMQVRLSENGQEVFARDWHDRIPRDMM